jgi:cytidylate kinase
VIVWINGPFGGGKTTTAAQLQNVLSDSRVFDPELVGYMLKAAMPDLTIDNFQDWSSWRRLVAATLDEVCRQTKQHLIAPQSILRADYFDEVFDALHTSGHRTFHVVLDAPEDVLRRRIERSNEAQPWRLLHLPVFVEARTWMLDRADLVVDAGAHSPSEVARVIHAALPKIGSAL